MLKPTEILDKKLMQSINKNLDNLDLKRNLINAFLQQGISSSIINSIFSGEVFINLLNDREKIVLTRALKSYLKLDIDEKDFFSDRVIFTIDNYVEEIKPSIKNISLKNFIEVDEYTYVGVLTYKEIYEYMTQNLLLYNMDLQREGTFIRFSDSYIKVPTVDQKSIENMIRCMKDNTLETGAITLGYVLKENEIPKLTINKNSNDMFDIDIEKLLIIDGMHRILSSVKYYFGEMLEAKEVDRKFIIKVIISDKGRLKRAVSQSFLMSNVTTEYLKSITEDDYTMFIDKLVNKSDILNGNVANTYEEKKFMNKTTTIEILRKSIEYLDIDVSNKSVQLFTTNSLSEDLDILIEMLKSNNCYLDIYNLFIPYIIFAYNIKKHDYKSEFYDKFIERMKSLTKDKIKELKLGNKIYNIKSIIDYFNVF